MLINLLILLAFLSICIISLRNIHIAFALVFAVDLFLPRGVHLFGMFPLREIFMIVTWGAFLYHVILRHEYQLKFNGVYKKPLIFFSFGILLILFFSTGIVSLGYQLKHIFGLIYYFSYAYIAWTIYGNKKGFIQFVKVLVFISFIMTLYGVFCYLTTTNPYLTALENFSGKKLIGGMEFARGGLSGRIQGTMSHPLTWAGCCGLLLLFFANDNAKISSTIKYLLISLLAVNMFLTGSRSALLALLISFLFFFLCSNKKKKMLTFVFLGGVVVFIALHLLPQLSQYKGMLESTIFFWDKDLASENEMGGSSTTMRLLQLLASIEMIRDNLFFGLGHGFVDYYVSTYGPDPILYGFESLVYNKLVEGGFVDLFLWFYLFFVLFTNIQKINKRSPYSQQTSILRTYVLFYFTYSLLTGFMQSFLCFIVLYAVLVRGLTVKIK